MQQKNGLYTLFYMLFWRKMRYFYSINREKDTMSLGEV